MNLQAIESIFHDNFALREELGASVSIWQNGKEILNLAGGFANRQRTEPWTAETPVLLWSATKGLAAACVLHALAARGIPLTASVAGLWPEFAQAGKSRVTLAQLLSHQAGLAALDREASVLDHAAVIRAVELQEPNWPLGEGHGYHPRTFGFLLDEIVRRVAGIPLGDYWATHFQKPLALDLWIGVPEDQLARVRPVFPAMIRAHPLRTPEPLDEAFFKAMANPQSLTARAFGSPRGLHSIASMNTPEMRRLSLPAFGGIGTASSLAKFYAMLANGGELDGQRFFAPETISLMTNSLSNGFDRMLQRESAFSAGFMRDPVNAHGEKLRATFGASPLAFGHPGAGGSVAFADPENRLAFAYVMNQMEQGVLPNPKSLLLIEALIS